MKNFLVAVDFSPDSEAVLSVASKFAQGLGARITLLHVAAPDPAFVGFEAGPQTVRDSRAEELRAEHTQLRHWAEKLQGEGVDAATRLVQGPTVEGIVAEAEKLDVDCIVVGAHGKGPLARMVLGSVSQGVLHTSPIPVLLVPRPHTATAR